MKRIIETIKCAIGIGYMPEIVDDDDNWWDENDHVRR